MNYYSAQQDEDGKWFFTCNGYPTGYCQEYKEFSEDDIKNFYISESQIKEHEDTKTKHHCCGHDTYGEACECFKQYMLDHRLRLGLKMSNQQLKCEACGDWTQNYIEIDYRVMPLCEKHNNRETVESLYKAPSQMWAS